MSLSDEPSLNSLIVRAKGGDREAFDGIAERYSPDLETFIRLKLGKKLAAKLEVRDLLQETFLRAWTALPELRGEGEGIFWSWLSTIAHHVILLEARKLAAKKRGAAGEVSLDQMVPAASGSVRELLEILEASGVSPSKALRRDERFDRLQKALEVLSPDHRRVIHLARVQGLQLAEVAEQMGRSVDAVSMLLYRALLKLKAAFGETDSLHLPDRSLEEEDHGERRS